MIIILVKYTYQTTHTSTPRAYILQNVSTYYADYLQNDEKSEIQKIQLMKSIITHQPPSTNQRKQTRKDNPFQIRIQESSYDNSSSTDNELSDLTISYNSFPSNIHPTDCSPNFIRDTTFTNLSVSNPSTSHSTNSKPSSQPSPLIHCTTSLTSRFPNETALEDEINTRLSSSNLKPIE